MNFKDISLVLECTWRFNRGNVSSCNCGYRSRSLVKNHKIIHCKTSLNLNCVCNMYSVQVVDPIRAEFLVSTLATHSSTPTPLSSSPPKNMNHYIISSSFNYKPWMLRHLPWSVKLLQAIKKGWQRDCSENIFLFSQVSVLSFVYMVPFLQSFLGRLLGLLLLWVTNLASYHAARLNSLMGNFINQGHSVKVSDYWQGFW